MGKQEANMAQCPNSIEELQELEKMLPLCRVTLYNQAKARIESGAAKSVSEAARQLADETGKSVEGIRSALKRECGTGSVNQLSTLTGTDKHRPYASSANKIEREEVQEPEQDVPLIAFDQQDEQIETQPYEAIQPSFDDDQPKYNHRSLGTGENEWYTPIEYIEAVRNVLTEIELDPASSEHAQQTISAKTFYTIDDNGLNQKWHGNVWMNPPYTQPEIKLFIQKLVDEYKSGNVTQAIALTHNYTDTSWFHIAADDCSAICFTRGRIAFVNPEGKKASPTQGQAFFYFGNNTSKFFEIFSKYGVILSRNE